ncbi:Putative Zn-dependent protease, contains TPR repeats [Franzmannia pantelleriensis]|uniref:Putative beta-barrel assembly-enhancing protease n=1 Tax=Franzmannia pantelleriensis TaxID=48727 RepID=A0A1G9PIB7_9GAMM|nr:M48 family metalloprotease [Halomonas pantelleriensis]SDL97875.1 Putative Zn-dependent protease, contains TPR repeats [Halomonas pantelleriensis]
MLHALKPCLAAAGLVLASLLPASASAVDDYGLPQLGSGGAGAAGAEEYRLGRAWLRQFRARAPAWQDPITQDYVESVISRLLPHSDLGDNRTSVTLVDSRLLNAFAVPGGVIGVNSGLFAFAEEEDAFASVIAHELGHLSQRHYARQVSRAEQTQVPAMAAMLAGMLIAAGGGGDAGIGVAMGSQAAFIQDQLAYSRRFEQEADRVGLQAMARAGYDPQAMVRMFRAMQRMASLQGGNPPEFLLTHPVTESRITDTEARASQLSTRERREVGPRYDLVRARALVSVNRSSLDQASARLAQGNPDPQVSRYLEALIAAERGNHGSALEILDTLANQLPDLPMLPVTAAEVAYDAGDYDAAIERSRRVLRLMPDYAPASRVLGEALLQRDPEEAYRVLRDLSERRQEDPQVFALLAEAAGRSGRDGWGHLARAEHMQLTGRMDSAIRQLQVARDSARQAGDSGLESRIDQRREAFMEYREALERF